MITKRGHHKVPENNSHWQSTPAPSKSHFSIKDSFGRNMPLTDLPSPVAADKLGKPVNKNEIKKPPMVEMICKAIEATGIKRKGASVPAIKKWIIANYFEEPEASVNVLNVRIRKALQKCLDTGMIDRSTKSAQLTGAKGYFIVKPKPKDKGKKANPPKNKAKPNYASDSEVTIIKSDKRKSSKMHASDTDLPSLKDKELKPKKGNKGEPKKSKKETQDKKMPKKTVKPKAEKEKPEKSKPDKPKSTAAKSKEKKAEEPKAKIEKPIAKKAASKPKKVNKESRSKKH